MKVAVTGADGQLGTNTVRELLKRRHTPICIVEPGRDTPTLDDLEVEIRPSDILDRQGLVSAFRGCGGVINIAGQARYWPRRSKTVDRVNILGAVSAGEAALEAGAERFVQIGSAGSFTPGSRNEPADETSALNIGSFRVSYIDSKRESMVRILKMAEGKKLPAVVVNPTFILGAWCGPSGSSSIIYKEQAKPFRSVPPGGRNFIHAADAASGIVSAMEKGRIGEAYILGHENLSYMELFAIIAETVGVEAPKKTAAPFMVKLAGHLATAADLVKGRTPSFTYAVARLTCEDYYYSSEKARKELNLPQTPIRQAVGDAVEWYRSLGLCS